MRASAAIRRKRIVLWYWETKSHSSSNFLVNGEKGSFGHGVRRPRPTAANQFWASPTTVSSLYPFWYRYATAAVARRNAVLGGAVSIRGKTARWMAKKASQSRFRSSV